jgi:hypothetical protein
MTRGTVDRDDLSVGHRAFDKMYPYIRFFYERILRQPWFSQVTPTETIPEELWLGGAPTYERDRRFLLEHGIKSVLDVRAEREGDTDFYSEHDIKHVRFAVPDVAAPSEEVIGEAVDWIAARVAEGRSVLVHCAKGRGRSATVLAAYLMRHHGLTYDEAKTLLRVQRPLTRLESRHKRVLSSWIAQHRKHHEDATPKSDGEVGDGA